MFTNLLNFIRPTKAEKPDIGSTHIQESLGINQDHQSKTPLLRKFSKKKKRILGETGRDPAYIKDAFDVSLEAIYAALTHQAPETEKTADKTSPENAAIQAYQKNMPAKHGTHDTPETAPWHEKTDKELQIEKAIQQIDILLSHDITHIFVKEGQSYTDALNEAIAYHDQKQGK